MTETYAYFWVSQFDGTTESMSERIGLQPTRAYLKGETNNRDKIQKYSGWELHSPLPRDEEFLEVHIAALLQVLEPVRENLAAVRPSCTMGIICVGYYSGNPGFELSEELISRCAALRLGIQFDLYCCGEAGE